MSNWKLHAKNFSYFCKAEFHFPLEHFPIPIQDVAIACSGGADSVFLVLWAYHFFEKNITLIHFNHALRGAESDADEIFVQQIASDLQLKFISKKLKNPPSIYNEDQLRQLRHEFFKQILFREQIAYLLLGHQKDDVAETLLMRLIRGSSLSGLCAPRPIQKFPHGTYWRPLLDYDRATIEQTLRHCQISWRQDKSNLQNDFLRNRIRNEVLPELRKLSYDNITHRLSRTRRLLEEDENALECLAQTWASLIQPQTPLPCSIFRFQPPGIVKRILKQWLHLQKLQDFCQWDFLENLLRVILAQKRHRMSAGDNTFLVFDKDTLFVEKKQNWPEIVVTQPCTLFLPNAILKIQDPSHEKIIAPEKAQQQTTFYFSKNIFLKIHHWDLNLLKRQLSAQEKVLLSKFLKKQPDASLLSQNLPIITSSQKMLLWVPFLPFQQIKISSNPKMKALILTYLKHSPK